MAIDKVSFMVLQSIQFQLPLTKGWCVQRDYLDCPNCRPESSDDSARTKGKRASRVFVTPDGYGWHGFTSKITIHYSSRDTTSHQPASLVCTSRTDQLIIGGSSAPHYTYT